MKALHYALVGAGPLDNPAILRPLILRHDQIIAVDGGLSHLHDLGITPHLLVGDLDSARKELLPLYPDLERIVLPRDKDLTDLEFAIDYAFEHGARSATLFAALNGRTDHTIGNLLLLGKRPGAIFIESEHEFMVAVSNHIRTTATPGQTVSIFALAEPSEGMITKGCKWELGGRTLHRGFTSLSNEAAADEVFISCQKGIFLLILQKTGIPNKILELE